jgi:hypothetical protein
MEINVIYASEVIYDARSNLACPGPRVAQRNRGIQRPDMKCREAAQFF